MAGTSTKVFYAMGQRDAARGLRPSPEVRRQKYLSRDGWTKCWPEFAKNAYLRGYHGLSLRA
jgi:hypothetical protein